jgi:hypothetical protein
MLQNVVVITATVGENPINLRQWEDEYKKGQRRINLRCVFI